MAELQSNRDVHTDRDKQTNRRAGRQTGRR